VKELCELAVRTASATGRWVAMATSNFCGPKFIGMWRDVSWHQRLTDVIHQGSVQRALNPYGAGVSDLPWQRSSDKMP
jgi:hypothetical protein